MVVIPHNREGVQSPSVTSCRLGYGVLESPRLPRALKQVAAITAAVEHMVNRAGLFDQKFSSHDSQKQWAREEPRINVFRPDPIFRPVIQFPLSGIGRDVIIVGRRVTAP